MIKNFFKKFIPLSMSKASFYYQSIQALVNSRGIVPIVSSGYVSDAVYVHLHANKVALDKALDYFYWKQTEVPFEDINALFLWFFGKVDEDRWLTFEKYIYFLFMHGDILNNMEQIFDDNIASFTMWRPWTKLYFISFLLFKNREAKAYVFLEKYIQQHGEAYIDLFPPVAALALRNFKIHSSEVIKLAKKYEMIMANASMLDRFREKSVALVGNSPNLRGQERGAEIDSHDEVIRFNGYTLSTDFSADYGRKVTVWANAASKIPASLDYKGTFSSYFYISSLFTGHEHKNALLDDCSTSFTYDFLSLRKRVYEETGVYTPSSGLLLIALLKSINPNFCYDDCFGFSFKDEKSPAVWKDYFASSAQKFTFHSLSAEREAVKKYLSLP